MKRKNGKKKIKSIQQITQANKINKQSNVKLVNGHIENDTKL